MIARIVYMLFLLYLGVIGLYILIWIACKSTKLRFGYFFLIPFLILTTKGRKKLEKDLLK